MMLRLSLLLVALCVTSATTEDERVVELSAGQGVGWCWGCPSTAAGASVRVVVGAEAMGAPAPRTAPWDLRSPRSHLYCVAFVLDENRELARREDGTALWTSVRKLRHNTTMSLEADLREKWTLHVMVASNALLDASADTACRITLATSSGSSEITGEEAVVVELLPQLGGFRGYSASSAVVLHKKRQHRRRRFSRLLAVDGGGARGVVPLAVLAELERETSTRSHDHFDMFAGTSTGAIVAACLCLAELPISVVQYLYCDLARLIFGSRGLSAIQRAARLEAVLSAVFGADATLDERPAAAALVIIATDASTIPLRPFVFRNFPVPDLGGGCFLSDSGSERARVVDALLASTAAPPYFPRRNCSVDGVPRRLLDGALVANNPTHFALAELASLNVGNDEEPLDLVLSLGTGVAPARARRELESGHNHLSAGLDFFEGLLNLLTDVDATHELVRRSLRPIFRASLYERYHRLDAVLDARQLRLDEGDDLALRDLRLLALDYFRRDKAREWHALVTALRKRATDTAKIQARDEEEDAEVYELMEINKATAANSWLRPLRKKTAKLTGLHGFFSTPKVKAPAAIIKSPQK